MNKTMTAILSAMVGGVIGYFVGKRATEKAYIHYTLGVEDEFVTPMSQRVSPGYDEELDATSPYEPPEDKPNIEDLASRYRTDDEHPTEDEPDEPYVITYDEFSEIGTNYTELLYYNEDDILVDEDDIILDISSTVGDCLSKFGVGTDDINMVYVKNPNTGKYYEVTRIYDFYYPVN